jgi:hypothetical protein
MIFLIGRWWRFGDVSFLEDVILEPALCGSSEFVFIEVV